ncbi:MAG: hypothetical protein PHI98_13125 [Eubacteriales bacterium]|nr:hypothetical protein [Eubacteriales bacterium]
MNTYLDRLLSAAEEQQALLTAAEALFNCAAVRVRRRLCWSAALMLILMAFPAKCFAMLG